jgi:hypothetical protein
VSAFQLQAFGNAIEYIEFFLTKQFLRLQHIHRIDMEICRWKRGCVKRLPYCSNSRVKYLYDEQTKIMKELNVPVMEVFEASYLSADQHFPQDTIHYQTAFNMFIQNSFYNEEDSTPQQTETIAVDTTIKKLR